MAKVRVNGTKVYFMCPGCKEEHWIDLSDKIGGAWAFNGDVEQPTISPSVHLMSRDADNKLFTICHSVVVDGMILFFGDSQHDLRGLTVDLPDMEV